MYNVHPDTIHLVIGEEIDDTFTLKSAKFFQTSFQAEDELDDDDAVYRFATAEHSDAVIVGRQRPGGDDWAMVEGVETVERVNATDTTDT